MSHAGFTVQGEFQSSSTSLWANNCPGMSLGVSPKGWPSCFPYENRTQLHATAFPCIILILNITATVMIIAAAAAKSLQLCPKQDMTSHSPKLCLCDPIAGSPPGSSVFQMFTLFQVWWSGFIPHSIGRYLLLDCRWEHQKHKTWRHKGRLSILLRVTHYKRKELNWAPVDLDLEMVCCPTLDGYSDISQWVNIHSMPDLFCLCLS